MLRLSWDEVDGVRARAVARGLARREAQPLENIGIDETSFQKRHEYVTVVYDCDREHVVDVLDSLMPTPDPEVRRRDASSTAHVRSARRPAES